MNTQQLELNFNTQQELKINVKLNKLFDNIDSLIKEGLPKDIMYMCFVSEIEELIHADYYNAKLDIDFITLDELNLFNSQDDIELIRSGASYIKFKRKYLEPLKELVFAEYK